MKIVKRVEEKDIDIIVEWMYKWWGIEEHYSKEEVYLYIKYGMQEERLPVIYGLYVDDQLIGIYQLTMHDLFIRPDLYPWLANVYIDIPYRNKGYGKYLLSTVKENAREHNIEKLYLYTSHNNFYEQFGFECIEKIDTHLGHGIENIYCLKI